MKLFIIFGQRRERYEGEHAPEALEITDEFTMDENPDWINEKLEEHQANKDFLSVKIIEVNIKNGVDRVRTALLAPPTLEGEIE